MSINEVQSTKSKSNGEWGIARGSFRVETPLAISMPKLLYITQTSSQPSPLGDEKTFTFFLTTFSEPYKSIVPTQTDGFKMNKSSITTRSTGKHSQPKKDQAK